MARYDVPLDSFGSGSATVAVFSIDDNCGIRWNVQWVDEHPKDGRRKTITLRIKTDDYSYRRLSPELRKAHEQRFFKDLLGETVYRDVLRQAWMMAMPEELQTASTEEE